MLRERFTMQDVTAAQKLMTALGLSAPQTQVIKRRRKEPEDKPSTRELSAKAEQEFDEFMGRSPEKQPEVKPEAKQPELEPCPDDGQTIKEMKDLLDNLSSEGTVLDPFSGGQQYVGEPGEFSDDEIE